MKLTQGIRSASPHALRIPAQELEQVVIQRIVTFLQDGVELLKLIDQHGLKDGIVTHAVLDSAFKKAEVLSNTAILNYASTSIRLLNDLIDRVIVSPHEIKINLIFESLIKQSAADHQVSPQAWINFNWTNLSHTLILPIQIKRSGLAVRLIIEPPENRIKRSVDPKLLKLLSKANIWFDRLTKIDNSMQQIVEEEQVSRSYVSRIIRLAFLALDIVKAIIYCKAQDTLTANKLIKHMPLPIDWNEQRKLLGF